MNLIQINYRQSRYELFLNKFLIRKFVATIFYNYIKRKNVRFGIFL